MSARPRVVIVVGKILRHGQGYLMQREKTAGDGTARAPVLVRPVASRLAD